MFDFQQAERQMIALKQYEYEIAKMRREPGAKKNLFQTDVRTIKDMKRKKDAYAVDTDRGENLYIRALPDNVHEVIFIDDTNQYAIDFLAEKGIEPACVVETSIKNGTASLHAWYLLSEATDRKTRRAIEYTLIKKLHEKFPHDDPSKMPGDFGSCDGGHLGRLAGSWNHGLSKPKNNAVVLVEATGKILSREVTARLFIEAEENKKIVVKLDADLEAIKQHVYENNKIIQWYKENAIPKMDSRKPHFQQDFAAVCKMLRAKFSEADIKKVLWEYDPNSISERKVGHEAHYLEVTLFNAKNEVSTPETSPSPLCGGRKCSAFLPSAVACDSVSASVSAAGAADSALAAPAAVTEQFFGYIENGKIFFNVNPPKNGTSTFPIFPEKSLLPQDIPGENPDEKTPFFKHKRKSHGVKPRAI